MCINQFYPIHPIMFWAVQLLCVSLPVLVFVVYCSHKKEKVAMARKLKRSTLENKNEKTKLIHNETRARIAQDRKKLSDGEAIFQDPSGRNFTSDEVKAMLTSEEKRLDDYEKEMDDELELMDQVDAINSLEEDDLRPLFYMTYVPKLCLAYVGSILSRTLIELLFMFAWFKIYSFQLVMPEQYQCDRAPCNNVVACYVDRPKQKTIVIMIMFAAACVTIMVGMLELFHIGPARMFKAWKERHNDISREYKFARMMGKEQLEYILPSPPTYDMLYGNSQTQKTETK